MDGSRLSLTGRVVLALVVLLALPWSAASLPPGTTGAPAAQPAVRSALRPPRGILGGHVSLVRTVAGHRQHYWRGYPLGAVLAVALAGTVVAVTRRSRFARSMDLDNRLLAFGPRAPPLRS
jgi:hypothetical protein